ncbi:MAG: limonene-1,2-epoxide hydrolase family protein [Sporichthyaceae bacterium]
MSDAQSVVQSFFDGMAKPGNLIAALENHFTDDAIWSNTGLPTANGLVEIKAFMQSFIDGFALESVVVDLIACAADTGGNVITERVDHLEGASGRLMSLDVAGTFVVTGGKISAWRDYFDPRPFLPPA